MPLYLIRNGELQTISSDRMPIGISSYMSTAFTQHSIKLNKGDIIYTFSDGFEDQFGGPNNKKFKIKNLRDLLSSIHSNPMNQQKDILQKALTDWMGPNFQVDDILIMGIKV
jgi:serine phosphatase RsbU (regulator of sigma subunit)